MESLPSDISLTETCKIGRERATSNARGPGDSESPSRAAGNMVSPQASWQEKLTWTQGCLESQAPGAWMVKLGHPEST